MSDETVTGDLEERFDRGMAGVYRRALTECNYNATRFHQMLTEQGGLQTARILLGASGNSDGFTALWDCDCLHLTVENLLLRPEFAKLFTVDERRIAKKRLSDYGFDPTDKL